MKNLTRMITINSELRESYIVLLIAIKTKRKPINHYLHFEEIWTARMELYWCGSLFDSIWEILVDCSPYKRFWSIYNAFYSYYISSLFFVCLAHGFCSIQTVITNPLWPRNAWATGLFVRLAWKTNRTCIVKKTWFSFSYNFQGFCWERHIISFQLSIPFNYF